MKWKSALVTALSGKIGGMVAATARGAQYFRAYVVPANRDTDFQRAVRDAVKTVSQRWSSVLTDDQRSAWAVYANNTTFTSPIGDVIKLSGANAYTRANVSRIHAGLAVVDDAPEVYDVGNPTSFLQTMNVNGDSCTFTGALDATGDAGDRLLVYASRPFSPGRAHPVGGNRLLGTCTSNGTTTSKVFTLPWTVPADSLLQLTVRLSRSDGRLSSTFQHVDAGL